MVYERASTHRALTERIGEGTFRADLYYRLNILNIALPPLRERATDLMSLAVELLLQAAKREPQLQARIVNKETAVRTLAGIGDLLAGYGWPGNVRELQNVIERIAVDLSEAESRTPRVLTGEYLRAIAPELFETSSDRRHEMLTLRERSRHLETDEIRAALDSCNGDRDAVCKALGISKTTLWRKLNGAANRQ
jgi:transcriptional regulator, propionate catabolism operon regulatory protein